MVLNFHTGYGDWRKHAAFYR